MIQGRFPDNSPQDNSPHGQLAPSKLAPRHLAPWTIRPIDNSPNGQLAPWTTRPTDNSPHGQLAPGTTRPMTTRPTDNSPHGQLAPVLMKKIWWCTTFSFINTFHWFPPHFTVTQIKHLRHASKAMDNLPHNSLSNIYIYIYIYICFWKILYNDPKNTSH